MSISFFTRKSGGVWDKTSDRKQIQRAFVEVKSVHQTKRSDVLTFGDNQLYLLMQVKSSR